MLVKRRHGCAAGHTFSTYEIPEPVFNAHRKVLLDRVAMAERGASQRADQAARREKVRGLLRDGGLSLDGIAHLANCSKSLVEKIAKENPKC